MRFLGGARRAAERLDARRLFLRVLKDGVEPMVDLEAVLTGTGRGLSSD